MVHSSGDGGQPPKSKKTAGFLTVISGGGESAPRLPEPEPGPQLDPFQAMFESFLGQFERQSTATMELAKATQSRIDQVDAKADQALEASEEAQEISNEAIAQSSKAISPNPPQVAKSSGKNNGLFLTGLVAGTLGLLWWSSKREPSDDPDPDPDFDALDHMEAVLAASQKSERSSRRKMLAAQRKAAKLEDRAATTREPRVIERFNETKIVERPVHHHHTEHHHHGQGDASIDAGAVADGVYARMEKNRSKFQGKPGAKGERGPRGLQGSDGMDGDRGAQGPRGLTGSRGRQGRQGPRGPQGPTGGNGGVSVGRRTRSKFRSPFD